MATVGRCPILGTPLERQAPGSGSPCCTLEGWRGSEMEVSSYWCTPIYGRHHMSVPKNKVYLPTCACIYIYMYIYIHSIYLFVCLFMYLFIYLYIVCVYTVYIYIYNFKNSLHSKFAMQLPLSSWHQWSFLNSWRAPNKPPVMLWILITNVQTRSRSQENSWWIVDKLRSMTQWPTSNPQFEQSSMAVLFQTQTNVKQFIQNRKSPCVNQDQQPANLSIGKVKKWLQYIYNWI
jgi:hypothetical protein